MDAIKAVLKRWLVRAALAGGLATLLTVLTGCVVIVPSRVCEEEKREIRIPLEVPCVPVEPRVLVVPVCTPTPAPVLVVPVCTPEVVCPTAVPQLVCPTQAAPTVCPTQAALTKTPAVVTATPERPTAAPTVKVRIDP